MKVRVYQNPDGSVQITVPNLKRIGDTPADFDLETLKNPELIGLPFKDVEFASLPKNRSLRYKFRMRNGRVEIDHAVPDQARRP